MIDGARVVAPGGPSEDPTGGFEHGGWLPQFFDEDVGHAIDAFFGWFAELFSSVANATPGGAATLWTLIGLVVVIQQRVQHGHVVTAGGCDYDK